MFNSNEPVPELFSEEAVDLVQLSENTTSFYTYRCNACGTTFCSAGRTIIKNCVICNQPLLNAEANSVEEEEIMVIPFLKTKNDAIKEYKRKLYWNPLVPTRFKRKKLFKSIRAIYLPAFLGNINCQGDVIFIGGDKSNVTRNGQKCVELKKYDVNQSVNFDYQNVLLNIHSKISETIFHYVCDYDYNHIQSIYLNQDDSIFLVGDKSIDEIAEKGRKQVLGHSLSIVRGNVHHSLKKLKENHMVVNFNNTKQIYVPIYLLIIKWKGKEYQFLMNGENGKSFIEIPIGALSTFIFCLFTFTILFIIAFLIAYYL